MNNLLEILIPESLINQIFEEIKEKDDENCGALIGKKLKNNYFEVTNIVRDNKPIFQSPIGVQRNTNNLYHLINPIVVDHPEGGDYIGEWHSHLSISCEYSQIDYLNMNMMIRDPDYSFLNEIILLIVGKNRSMKAFCFCKTESNPKTLKIQIKK